MTKTQKFEDAMKRLEDIVSRMESGQGDLDSSLELFEEGVKLVRFCSSKLDEAKKKIEILVKKGDKTEPEPFTLAQEQTQAKEEDLFK